MNRPWMPLYIADYLADTAHLNAAQSGAYLHLIMHYWQTGGLPDDDAALARIGRMTTVEWRKARPIIAPFFADGWRHKRIDAEMKKTAEVAEAYSSRARQAANKRWSKDAPSMPEASSEAPSKQCLDMPISQPQPQRKKEEDAADAAPTSDLLSSNSPSPPARAAKSYAFESGIIRLSQKDFDKWKRAYSHLDLEAELLSMTRWAAEQGPENWFFAVSGALAKRNRELGLRIEQNRADGLTNDERYFGVGRLPGVV